MSNEKLRWLRETIAREALADALPSMDKRTEIHAKSMRQTAEIRRLLDDKRRAKSRAQASRRAVSERFAELNRQTAALTGQINDLLAQVEQATTRAEAAENELRELREQMEN